MAKRCMGECCTDIGITVSPERLKEDYIRWTKVTRCVNFIELNKDAKGSLNDVKIFLDIHLIYPAWEFLKKDHFHPEFPKNKLKEYIYHYRCRFFNKEKKKCDIYEIRPDVCRVYGTRGHVCHNPKCKWDEQIKKRKELKKREEKCKKENPKLDKKVITNSLNTEEYINKNKKSKCKRCSKDIQN